MKLITRADIARLAGVSKAAITQACRTKLRAACHEDLVDAEHEASASYLKAHRKRLPRSLATRSPRSKRPDPKPARPKRTPTNLRGAGRKRKIEPPEDAPDAEAPKLDEWGFCDAIQDLTAGEISQRYGSNRAYAIWLDAYQKQQRARELYLKNEQTEGALVSRELVLTHVFATLDVLFRRFLTDVPKTGAAEIYAQALSGASIERGESKLKDINEKQLKAVKLKILRALKEPR
jgi:hypothetical protein